MALRLLKQDPSFFDLLADLAGHGVQAAQGLGDLLGARGDEVDRVLERLRDVEASADERTHALSRKVDGAFVTPFDHADIIALAAALDSCVDEMERVAFLLHTYRVTDPPPGVVRVIGILGRMAQLTADAMPRLRTPRSLEDYRVEINRLENQADQLYRRMLTEIFDGRLTDPVQIITRRDLIEGLEDAADCYERVSHQVHLIAAKGS